VGGPGGSEPVAGVPEDPFTLRPFGGHAGAVWAVAVTPDGSDIITGGNDGTVRIWDRTTRTSRATLTDHTGWVFAVAVTPDGSEIITGGDDGTVRAMVVVVVAAAS
jgi:WD40 repeat protein